MPHKFTGQIGTFIIVTRETGFIVRDTCRFNHWPDSEPFRTRDAAEDYASRCHLFKIGRRSTV